MVSTVYGKIQSLGLLRYSKVNSGATVLSTGKGKGRSVTGHEGPEGEQMYSATLPSTSALVGGWVVNATPRPLYPQERPGTYLTCAWVGTTAGLDGCGKSRAPTGIRSQDRPARSESLGGGEFIVLQTVNAMV